MSRIFGGPFNQSVLEALQARQNLLNKDYIDDKELVFLNSNHSWIKLTSCVNLTEGGDKLAKDNVLMGGTLYEKTVRQGFRPGQDESSYEFNTEFGFVPMPGIDSITVETKNVYGSLKAASVEFKANSPEQLSKLEKLFLRPGFSVLVEWGNTHYLDKDTISEVEQINEEEVSFGSDIQAVYDEIIRLRGSSKYNYDALFGVIKNYQWAYAENGEYDCKVDIIGRGELIESLQTLFFSGVKAEEQKEEGDRNQVGTALQQFLEDINNYYKEEEFKGEKSKEIVKRITKNLGIDKLDIHTHLVDSAPPNNKYFYMPFSHILEAINVCLMLKHDKDKPIVSFNTKKIEGKSQPFVTYKEHRIIDPAVGFIPNSSCFKFQKKGSADSILDIYINIKSVLDILKGFEKNKDTENTTVLKLVKDILAQLETSAGNINDFDIHFDDDDRKYYVIDRDQTPDPSELLELQAIGKGSTFLDISFSSKLSSRISSMIAISARVGNTDAGEQLLGMQKWNEGLQDRFIKEKYIFEVEETEDDKKGLKDSIDEYIKTIEKGEDTYIESESKESMKSHNRSAANSAIREIKNKEGIPGLVPLELTVTLKGISGFKVGQGFLLDETILPEAYRGKVGFIITGVAHTFDNNTWQTELNSQTFMIG